MEISLDTQESKISKNAAWLILVASLGYFVDIYDLLLFIIVRIPSLKGIGITNPKEITAVGTTLLNIQSFGLLAGGFIWGILGDKRGRLTVLFGSIIMYSLANILNGLVTEVWQYGALRFLAGLGLAGELGAGITLVSETMKKENRGHGTMLIAGIGVLGAVVANLVSIKFNWRVAFFVGGGLGLILLLLRIGVFESGIFTQTRDKTDSGKRGNLFDLFGNRKRLLKYFYTSFIALPIWFTIGVLMAFSREFGIALHLKFSVEPGLAISYSYLGGSLGNLISGALSQWAQSRKRIVGILIPLTGVLMILYLNLFEVNSLIFYSMCFLLGIIGAGFWVLFVTMGAEQFGTNLRATAATSLPNVARAYVIPMVSLWGFLAKYIGGIVPSAICIAILTVVLASWGLWNIQETFGKDLNYMEE